MRKQIIRNSTLFADLLSLFLIAGTIVGIVRVGVIALRIALAPRHVIAALVIGTIVVLIMFQNGAGRLRVLLQICLACSAFLITLIVYIVLWAGIPIEWLFWN
ncbi:MAG: hypothetical protein JWM11_174 [Planctomycetaceae bacterium]|nr:hypothetical protein [Planctomycetaceae bacterium]